MFPDDVDEIRRPGGDQRPGEGQWSGGDQWSGEGQWSDGDQRHVTVPAPVDSPPTLAQPDVAPPPAAPALPTPGYPPTVAQPGVGLQPATPPQGVPYLPAPAQPPGGPASPAPGLDERRRAASRAGRAPAERRRHSEGPGSADRGAWPSVVHQPRLGAVIALAGLVMLWIATRSTAWVDNAGRTFTLSELGTSAEVLGEFRLVRWYADWGWKLVVAYVVFVAVLATLVNLTSSMARTALWFPVAGPFALFNLTDRTGRAAPRILGAITMLAPAAVLGAVWVNLLVQPKIDPSVQAPPDANVDPEAFADQEQMPDPETLRELQESGDLSTVDLDTLVDLGLEWRGFEMDQLGNGLWMSFGGLILVGVGAIVGTRAPRQLR